ncbi:MAG: repeat containing protein [Firmicutes bacterium]|nr:repeat containing protein [Bacillota bacterium]
MNDKWIKGTIHRFAGTGIAGYYGDGEKAETAQLNGPAGLAVDKDNNVFVAEMHNNIIRRIDARTGIITTVAGNCSKGFAGDSGLAVHAKINGPLGVFVDVGGNIFIADSFNHRIRKVDAKTGIITTIAGTGVAGYAGDGINACNSQLNFPCGVVGDSNGNIYFNDFRNDRVRKISTDGMISTHAGTGIPGYSGDLGPADKAQINQVYGLAIDQKDNIYLMDSANFAVRKVAADSGIITTIAEKGNQLFDFSVEVPHAIEIGSDGNIFIGDTGSYKIHMINVRANCAYTIGGTGEKGYSGDQGLAQKASLAVHGLRMDSKNNLYFVDFISHVVRLIRF